MMTITAKIEYVIPLAPPTPPKYHEALFSIFSSIVHVLMSINIDQLRITDHVPLRPATFLQRECHVSDEYIAMN